MEPLLLDICGLETNLKLSMDNVLFQKYLTFLSLQIESEMD